MQPDVLWLVSLGTTQGLFNLHQARQVRSAVGDKVDLMGFAQKLIDDGHVHDIDLLEKVAGLAMVEQLTLEVWALADLPMPTYARADIPVRLYRPGEKRES